MSTYEQAIGEAWDTYRLLNETLLPQTRRIVTELRHVGPLAGEKRRKRVEREAGKKAIEISRYVIPIAAFTSMVHTVSGLVLHRLYRMMRSADAPSETASVVTRWWSSPVRTIPTSSSASARVPSRKSTSPNRTLPRMAPHGDDEARHIDARLAGRASLLVDFSANGEQTVADAVRTVIGAPLGALSDDEALALALDPSQNRQRLETLALGVHSPVGRTLHHATYTFLKKLSHTADSQDQRHRMVPASRPLMRFTDTAQPDCVVPALVSQTPLALEIFERQMERAWTAKNRLLELGVPLEGGSLRASQRQGAAVPRDGEPPLPLAEVGPEDLLQCPGGDLPEPPWRNSSRCVAVHPRLARHLGPPCVLRAGLVSPVCTEGEHFCGVPVWRDFPNAKRLL